jgi:hypothetical protein
MRWLRRLTVVADAAPGDADLSSICTVRIGGVVFSAVTPLEDAEIGLVHVAVAVEVGRNDAVTVSDEITVGRKRFWGVRDCWAGGAALKRIQIVLIDITVAIEVSG